MKTLKYLLMTVIAATLSVQAFAMPPGAGGAKQGHHIERMLNKLDLTEEQRAELKSLKKNQREAMQALRGKQRELADKMHASDPMKMRSRDIDALSREQGALSEAMTRMRLQHRVQVHKLLTPEQREQLEAMKAEWRERHQERMEKRMERMEKREGRDS